jgi:hypothetical protein
VRFKRESMVNKNPDPGAREGATGFPPIVAQKRQVGAIVRSLKPNASSLVESVEMEKHHADIGR